MKTKLLVCVVFILILHFVFADYVIVTPQPLARGLSEKQLDAVLSKTPAAASVTLPAHLLVKKQADIKENLMLLQFQQIISDTRSNIVECATMSDIEIAALYINQMTKSTDQITAPTNTLEYIIGAGMRADLKESKNVKETH